MNHQGTADQHDELFDDKQQKYPCKQVKGAVFGFEKGKEQHDGNGSLCQFICNRIQQLAEGAHLIESACNLSVKEITESG